MPVIKAQYDHVKVYRPNGTRYSQFRHCDLRIAMIMAKKLFMDEFGFEPEQQHIVWEIIGATGIWIVDFFEVLDQALEKR